ANYNAAPDVSQSFSIAKANQLITFAALGDKTYGDADFNVSATGGGSGNPVTFAASGNCTVAGTTVHLGVVGNCTITASQAGNANYNAAPDVPRTFAITKRPTSTQAISTSITYGTASVNVSASVDKNGGTISPSAGTVAFTIKDSGSNVVG